MLYGSIQHNRLVVSIIKKLQELLENDYEDFESLHNIEKSFYVLRSELSNGLLSLVKEYNYCSHVVHMKAQVI